MMRVFVGVAGIAACLTAAPAFAQGAEPVAQAAPSSADARLKALYEREWAWRQAEFAETKDSSGRSVSGDRFPKVDAAAQAARLAYWRGVLKELDAIPANQLSDEERINADVFRASIEGFVTEIKFKTYEAPFNSDSFFWADLTPRSGYRDATEYRRYLGRLKDLPRYFDDQIVNMRAGMKRGYMVPRVGATGRDKTIEPYLKADATNPLMTPFATMPVSMPAAEQAALTAEGQKLVNDSAVPAYAKLLKFLREEYLPATTTEISAAKLPDGKRFYRARIRQFTTLDLSPKQIHDIGLKEVARIRADMEKTKAEAKFEGDLKAFIAFLRTDPQFYAKTPRELLSYSAYVSKKADYKLKDMFVVLPRYRHGIVKVPDAIAPVYTSGRGGLDTCLMNTFNLPARPLYALPALTLHECTPGHSFQAALALEGPDRPDFRKDTYFSGYGEGWGLYTEWLGKVMGIYEGPYEEFGRQTFEMWRAARLVIDTGMHEYGWSRQRAIDYLKENTALSELDITNEVDRYISWPAQALAYKLGELQIRRHRAEAEKALGPKFDQRHFHDAILALGSVPLPTLERRMNEFIAAGGVNPASDAASRQAVRP